MLKLPEQLKGTFFPINEIWLLPNDLALYQVKNDIVSAAQSRQVLLNPKIYPFIVLENKLALELEEIIIEPSLRKIILLAEAKKLASTLFPELRLNNELHYELAEELGVFIDRLRLDNIDLSLIYPENSVVSNALAAATSAYDAELAKLRVKDKFILRKNIIESLKNGRKFNALQGIDQISVFKIQHLSPFDADFIKALAMVTNVKLSFSAPFWLKDEEISSNFAYEQLRILRSLEKNENLNLEIDFLPSYIEEAPEALAYISEYLLAPVKNNKIAPDIADHLKIIKTSYRWQEVELALRQIKKLIIQGVEPHKIALVSSSQADYETLIDSSAKRLGISFYFRRGLPIINSSLINSIFALLALWGSNWERSRIINFLNLPWFSFTGFDLQVIKKLSFDFGVTDERAGGGFHYNLSKAKYSVKKLNKTTQTSIDEKQQIDNFLLLLNSLKQFGSELRQSTNWYSFIKTFKQALIYLNWPSNKPNDGFTKVEQLTVSAFMETLDELKNIFEHHLAPTPSIEIFQLWLKEILREKYIIFDKNPEGRVWSLNPHEVHGGVFDYIFFLGLNEGVFPSAKGEGLWWPEEFRQAAKKKLGRTVWNSPADSYKKDEELFASLLGSVKKQAFLYYSAWDVTGRTLAASSLVESLKNLWPEGVLEETFEDFQASFRPYNLSCSKDMAIFNAYKAGLSFSEKCLFDKNLINPAASAVWKKNLPMYKGFPLLTISVFKDYADCPLKFYWKHILKLKKPAPNFEEWPKSAEGEMAHKILEKFIRQLLIAGLGNFNKGDLESFKNIIEKEEEKFFKNYPLGREPLWRIRCEKLKKFLIDWYKREIEKNLDSQTLSLEWSFDCDADQEPLEINAKEKFFLKGRLDRLDKKGDELVVIDYKLSFGDNYDPKDITASSFFPLMSYTLAAAKLGMPAQGVLEFLDSKGVIHSLEVVHSNDDILSLDINLRDKLKSENNFNFINILEKIWDDINQGIFEPSNRYCVDCKCEYCSYEMICPKAEEDLDV